MSHIEFSKPSIYDGKRIFQLVQNTLTNSAGNIISFSRNNIFFVYNSIKNKLEKPYNTKKSRPEHIATQTIEKITLKPFVIEKNSFVI